MNDQTNPLQAASPIERVVLTLTRELIKTTAQLDGFLELRVDLPTHTANQFLMLCDEINGVLDGREQPSSEFPTTKRVRDALREQNEAVQNTFNELQGVLNAAGLEPKNINIRSRLEDYVHMMTIKAGDTKGWRFPQRGEKVRCVKLPETLTPKHYPTDKLEVGNVYNILSIGICCAELPSGESQTSEWYEVNSCPAICIETGNTKQYVPVACFEPA